MSDVVLEKLRVICLAFPEAVEAAGVGDPTFKVRDKIFAMRHPMNERSSMWCKAAPGLQEGLVSSDPEHFFVPPYVGQHGWGSGWMWTWTGILWRNWWKRVIVEPRPSG